MPSMSEGFFARSTHLNALLNSDPAEAVRQARQINLHGPDRLNLMSLRATVLVDGGALIRDQEAIEEGLELFRELHGVSPTPGIIYNLANGLVAATDFSPADTNWLDHQERTRGRRAEARQCFWKVVRDFDADDSLRTQAWTNLANQFSNSFRLGEAHDAWLTAIDIDPENGVAASSAARNLLWLYDQGGASELARVEAAMLAKVATLNQERIAQYAGAQAAEKIAVFASEVECSPPQPQHEDPFFGWIERERLTLSPVAGLVDITLGKADWLTLPGILERESGVVGSPPPVFAMFNVLKGDFILARDLAWRASNESAWPTTGKFGDTLDYATYGPDASALVLAHRTALDLLDKVAVTANHYFELGQAPDKVYFGKLWRGGMDKTTGVRPVAERVGQLIRGGVRALYGLVELADDYEDSEGILRPQKDLRNAGTHRFVVLHDFGGPVNVRESREIEHHERELFTQGALGALRIARSAIQMLAISISQNEQGLQLRSVGPLGSLIVPDHDWIRGRTEND